MTRRLFREFAVPLLVCLGIVVMLTEIAARSVTLPKPMIAQVFGPWIKENDGQRFDDVADGAVLVNYLYRVLVPRLTFWSYFKPDGVPPHDWERLRYAADPANQTALQKAIEADPGEPSVRYWTGHLVATTLLLRMLPDLNLASKATRNLLLVVLFVYALAWQRNFGRGSAVVLFSILVLSGCMNYESFHNHTWGLMVALGAGAYTSESLHRRWSCYVPAVVGGVFGNWLGYDYVFDTIAFSMPFFLAKEGGCVTVKDLGRPLAFLVTVLAITALMMVLRVPVMYIVGTDPSAAIREITEYTLYRMGGELSRLDYIPNTVVSRMTGVERALPLLNLYLFRLLGQIAPHLQSVGAYIALVLLPLFVLLARLVRGHRRFDENMGVRFILVVGTVMVFHTMFIAFYNHTCVHPYMDVRHMVFSLAASWALALGAIRREPD